MDEDLLHRWYLGGGIAASVFFLLLVLMGGSRFTRPVPPHTVYITETDYQITATQTNFQPGITYHFVVKNASMDTHEFMVGPKMPMGMSMDDMHKQALGMIDTIAPGQTKTLNLKFPMSVSSMPTGTSIPGMMPTTSVMPGMLHAATAMPGNMPISTMMPGMPTPVPSATATMDMSHLEFSCHLPGHYEAGMALPITVA